MATIEERLNELEKELTSKRKDGWDILGVIATAFVPIALTVLGYMFSQALADTQARAELQIRLADRESTERLAANQEVIARMNARVGQAQLVSAFLTSLLSGNPQERQLAISAVLIGLPDDGPNLVRIIADTDTNEPIRKFAGESLERRGTELVEQVASADLGKSQLAAQQLQSGWTADPRITGKLLTKANADIQNTNLVIQTFSVLERADSRALAPHRDAYQRLVNQTTNHLPALKPIDRAIQKKM